MPPSIEETLAEYDAEIARREAEGEVEEEEPQMPLQMQQGMAEQAQAQALNPAQQPVEETAELSPQDLTGLFLQTPEKKSTKKADKVYPTVYEFDGKKIDVSDPRFSEFRTDTEAKEMGDIIDSTGKALTEVKDVRKKLKPFKQLTKGNLISPANPYLGGVANAVTNIAANTVGLWKGENEDRSRLKSALDKLRSEADIALKGGGPLGIKLLEMYEEMKLHPNMEEGWDVLEGKLDDLEHLLKVQKEGAIMARATNRKIPFDEVEDLLGTSFALDHKKKGKKAKSSEVSEDKKQDALQRYNSDPANAKFLGLSDEAKLSIMKEHGDL